MKATAVSDCICISKVTKFKANNNASVPLKPTFANCICISKVTKFKANNNSGYDEQNRPITVFA